MTTITRLPGPLPTGVVWRAALAAVAAAAVAIEAPVWVRLPLSLAAAAGTATFFARRHGHRGVLDVVLVIVGGALVSSALLGLLLAVTPLGLTTGGWGIGIGVLELVVLALVALRRAPATRHSPAVARTALAPTVLWGGASAIVLAAAIGLSAVSFGAAHTAPVALAAEPGATSTTVTATSGTRQGPYSVVLVTPAGRTVLATDVQIGPDRSWTRTIANPARRERIELVPDGSTTAERTLTLDPADAR